MDLVDLIESHRFLGSEYLTWLWFRSEMHDGMIAVGDGPAPGSSAAAD